MPVRVIMWCILITCFTNCKDETYSNCNTTSDPVIPLVINMGDTLHLYLDSLMVMGISTPIDYHEKEHTLYVLDNYNNRLLQYPITTSLNYPDSIHLLKIKKKITYFKYISADSMLLYAYSGAALFYHSTFSFINKAKGRSAAPPYANAACPLIISSNTIIGFGFLIGESEHENPAARTLASIIDLNTGNIHYRTPYSKVYWQHNWGGAHLRTPYTSYDEKNKKILLSLPADHHIQVIDSNWQIKEIAAETRKKICITSMPVSKDNKQVSDAEYTLRYFTHTPSYRNIIYDKYHERYYRILELPPADNKLLDKVASLIVFDKGFKYVGEADLPKALALDNFFLTADGIYFLNANNKDQNIAQYVQCKIQL